MITIDLPSPLVRIEGAVELRPEAAGLRPSRLPAWALAQVPSPMFALIADATTGVRLRLRTTATALELTLALTRAELPVIGHLPAVFDLRIDGRHHARQAVEGGNTLRLEPVELVPGPLQTVRFDELPAGRKTIEIWLPHTAICDLVTLATDAGLQTPEPVTAPRWIHYGSSISQCVEAEGPLGTWPATAATGGGFELTCLGFAGNAMLDPFVARTIRSLPAEVISLEIGANIVEQATMRTRTFVPAVHGFLDTIREGHPGTPIVVISPIALPVAEDRSGIIVNDPVDGARALGTPANVEAGALTMRIVRDHLERLVAQRAANGEAISYLSGLDLLGLDEASDLYDGIHPNAAAHLRIGDRFAKTLATTQAKRS
jgi:hypothetical protein